MYHPDSAEICKAVTTCTVIFTETCCKHVYNIKHDVLLYYVLLYASVDCGVCFATVPSANASASRTCLVVNKCNWLRN